MDKFIKSAKKGGYKDYIETSGSSTQKYHSDILLDPVAWQSCGKAEGWIEGMDKYTGEIVCEWKTNWHNFIDYLAKGKNIESFFINLLK